MQLPAKGFSDDAVAELAAKCGFKVIDKAHIPGRQAVYLSVPAQLDQAIRKTLMSSYPEGLFGHQAEAIQAGLDGYDISLSTSTGSGKSLVFISLAAHLVRQDPSSRVLALYPARALIQDQIEKWTAMLAPLGVTSGYVDGSVPIDSRVAILTSNPVVLMTPDVAHAWLMSHLREAEVKSFLSSLRLLILDEAHVYDGVFGTNMAYFLRRLETFSGRHQLVCSTATLGRPADFIQQLTGRNPRCFDSADDQSLIPAKTILLASDTTGKTFDATVNLLVELARSEEGRFLAFADSRRVVEQLVAAAHRSFGRQDEDHDVEDYESSATSCILPYRAGYETEDRHEIQEALGQGRLVGVVSTSALELGLDIGDIDLVVLLGVPPSTKAFWQRLGRAGRRQAGTCLLLDDRQVLVSKPGGLTTYLQRELEPNWLYLENRYIQYANALCTAFELGALGTTQFDAAAFASLPDTFRRFLENELNPAEVVPSDLYPLKQRAQGGPHREFPMRSGVEQEFHVKTVQGLPLGTLTFSQALREGYPGAIYYYMARPYRVYRFVYRKGEIYAKREKRWTTKRVVQTMVFPRFQGGTLSLFRSEAGFMAEAELQVSERVLGFVERRGGAEPEEHRYGPHSPYYPRELNRFFETTGVCWYFPDRFAVSEAMARWILEAFCLEFSIQERDLGVGFFFSKQSPLALEKCQGVCIYDATNGSLRLTQRLAQRFSDVVVTGIQVATNQKDVDAVKQLDAFAGLLERLRPVLIEQVEGPVAERGDDWVLVVGPGEKAIYLSSEGPLDVEVISYRYTPQGLMYELVSPKPNSKWMVAARAIQPVHGQTKMLYANLVTGETKDVG